MTNVQAHVLADSIAGPAGTRLTTLEIVFPRPYLAEFNTHRVFSRNSASSRAIPPEKHVSNIRRGIMYVPVFGSRVKGMGQGEDLPPGIQAAAQKRWRSAANDAADHVEYLLAIGGDKSHINRLLEPFLWHTVIVSATEWDNFFALRDHPAAQKEVQDLAQTMRAAMQASTPEWKLAGQWHLPLVTRDEMEGYDDPEYWAMVSAGRCARVSFDSHHNLEDADVSYKRAEQLSKSGHWSPFEHPAQATTFVGPASNFRFPWRQYRKFFDNEAVFQG